MHQRMIVDAAGNTVTPDVVLYAYMQGCFPMADARSGRLAWYQPQVRAVLDWQHVRVRRSLRKRWRQQPYRITINTAFRDVVQHCAEREETWICHDIEALYCQLHLLGYASSIEAWDADHHLVGGCYGLALGSCFCGESMFHRAPDAGHIAVLSLIAGLQYSGFDLLDVQQQSPHMQALGAYEIDEADYASKLQQCLQQRPVLQLPPKELEPWQVLNASS